MFNCLNVPVFPEQVVGERVAYYGGTGVSASESLTSHMMLGQLALSSQYWEHSVNTQSHYRAKLVINTECQVNVN